MPNANNSLINLGDLSKPATVLIERISDAVGGIFLPYQIERVAKAQAKAEKIKANTSIEITKLQRRALGRLLQEESDKQKNIESITQKAIPKLAHTAEPKNIDRDWLINFFDRARLISDSEMQDLWSKMLAGEANTQGSFSKRTISLVAILDKKDASVFTTLSSFMWNLENTIVPVVINPEDKIYSDNGINFGLLKNLDSIGLISFDPISGYKLTDLPKSLKISYKGKSVRISFLKDKKNDLDIGQVLYTSVGEELFRICNSSRINGFENYVIEKWNKEGIKTELIDEL